MDTAENGTVRPGATEHSAISFRRPSLGDTRGPHLEWKIFELPMAHQVITSFENSSTTLLILLLFLLCPYLLPNLEAETLPHQNISSRLLSVVRGLETPGEGEMKTPNWLESLQATRVDQVGRLEVMIETTEITPQVLKELEARGGSIEIYDTGQNLVQAWVPPGKIGEVAVLPFVKFVDLPNYGVTNRPGE